MSPKPVTPSAAMIAADPGLERRSACSVRQWLDSPRRRATDSALPPDAWFRTYHPLVVGILRRMGMSAHDAQDAAQDVMVRVVVYLRNHPGSEVRDPVTWFGLAARNVGFRLLGRRHKQPVQMPAIVPEVAVTGDIEALIDAKAVRAAVAALPKELRVVFKLAWFRGRYQEDIAERLHLTRGQVQYRLGEAKTRVKAHLARQGFVRDW